MKAVQWLCGKVALAWVYAQEQMAATRAQQQWLAEPGECEDEGLGSAAEWSALQRKLLAGVRATTAALQ